MKTINIYLNLFAHYVRLDLVDLEEYKKQSSYKKWVENRNGKLIYEFIEFEIINDDHSKSLPWVTTKIGLKGSRYSCYNPFKLDYIAGDYT